MSYINVTRFVTKQHKNVLKLLRAFVLIGIIFLDAIIGVALVYREKAILGKKVALGKKADSIESEYWEFADSIWWNFND